VERSGLGFRTGAGKGEGTAEGHCGAHSLRRAVVRR
jgi:hypothetical protein